MSEYPGSRPPAGSIAIEDEGPDRRVLCLRGDVDTAVATRFTSSQGRDRVAVDAIDAGTVTFISSSGLALMLLCVEASLAAGRHPVLRAASPQVDRALRMAGLDSVFPRPETDSQAGLWPQGRIARVPTLHITQDPAADELLGRDPLALLIGMLLAQHMRQRSPGSLG